MLRRAIIYIFLVAPFFYLLEQGKRIINNPKHLLFGVGFLLFVNLVLFLIPSFKSISSVDTDNLLNRLLKNVYFKYTLVGVLWIVSVLNFTAIYLSSPSRRSEGTALFFAAIPAIMAFAILNTKKK